MDTKGKWIKPYTSPTCWLTQLTKVGYWLGSIIVLDVYTGRPSSLSLSTTHTNTAPDPKHVSDTRRWFVTPRMTPTRMETTMPMSYSILKSCFPGVWPRDSFFVPLRVLASRPSHRLWLHRSNTTADGVVHGPHSRTVTLTTGTKCLLLYLRPSPPADKWSVLGRKCGSVRT